MACVCCGATFCCSGGAPASVSVQFYSPVTVSASTPGYDPVSPLLGTYVLARDTAAESYLGWNGTTLAGYGLYPAGKSWQDGVSIPSSQWSSVPTGDIYILAQLTCNANTSVSVTGVSVIAKAIANTTTTIFGVVFLTAYRTSFTIYNGSLQTNCGITATSAEATQTWNHVEIYYRAGAFTGTSNAYFDTSKTKVSVTF